MAGLIAADGALVLPYTNGQSIGERSGDGMHIEPSHRKTQWTMGQIEKILRNWKRIALGSTIADTFGLS